MDSFKHDVFISYSSDDRPWAELLFNSLMKRGLDIFYDRARLEVGQSWEPQLLSALNHSRHLLVLWSDRAKTSDWVTAEVNRFLEKIDPKGTGQPTAGRGVIEINLEGKNSVLDKYQRITILKTMYDSTRADAGIGALSASTLNDLIDQIEMMVLNHDTDVLIPVTVLSTTKSRLLNDVSWNTKSPGGGLSLNDIVNQLELVDAEALLAFYGDNWRNWRPFQGEQSIWQLLGTARLQVNQTPNVKPFRWKPMSDILFEYLNLDSEKISPMIEAEVMKLRATTSVIIIDPISLYDPDVKWLFDQMYSLLNNPTTLIFALPPVEMPMSTTMLRKIVSNVAKPIYDHFFNPPIHQSSYAYCAGVLDDELDIHRWLLTTIGAKFRTATSSEKVPFVTFGS